MIFSLWKIDLVGYIKMKAVLSKVFRLQPSEIDIMPFWEYELFVNHLNELVKEENDQQKAEMDKYHVNEYMNMARPGNMQKMMSSAQPKTPNMGNMSMPNMGNMGAMKF